MVLPTSQDKTSDHQQVERQDTSQPAPVIPLPHHRQSMARHAHSRSV
jgi:hypothetical protein